MSIKGEKTRAILLEKMADIEKELYLSLFLNRSKRCYTIIASSEGGVEIESVKNQTIKEVGLGDVDDETAKKVANEIGLQGSQEEDAVQPVRAGGVRQEEEVSPHGRLARPLEQPLANDTLSRTD